MKMKLKALVAALALAGVAGQASATIADGSTGNGELFLTVWSETLQQSYTRDLGISMSDFAVAGSTAPVAGTYAFNPNASVGTSAGNVNTSGYSLTFSADSTLTSSLLSATDTVWMIGAIDSTGVATGNKNMLTTLAAPIGPMTNSILGTGLARGNTFLSAVNATGTHGIGTAVNGSSLNTPADSAFAGGNTALDTWTSTLSGSAVGSVGQSLSFWLISNSASGGTPNVNTTQYANSNGASYWTLSANGTLSYAASPVPVPAAVWLLGSGLTGLVGISRRRKQVGKQA